MLSAPAVNPCTVAAANSGKLVRCTACQTLRGNLRIAAYEKARAHPRLFGQLADQNAIAEVCDCAVRLSEISPSDQPEQVRIAAQFLEAVGDNKLDRGLLLRDCPPQVHEYIQKDRRTYKN